MNCIFCFSLLRSRAKHRTRAKKEMRWHIKSSFKAVLRISLIVSLLVLFKCLSSIKKQSKWKYFLPFRETHLASFFQVETDIWKGQIIIQGQLHIQSIYYMAFESSKKAVLAPCKSFSEHIWFKITSKEQIYLIIFLIYNFSWS